MVDNPDRSLYSHSLTVYTNQLVVTTIYYSLVSRAETILSGVIVRPDPQDPNSTRMSLMLQNDIKGWIPHFIVNVFVGTVDLRHSHHTHMMDNCCCDLNISSGNGRVGWGNSYHNKLWVLQRFLGWFTHTLTGLQTSHVTACAPLYVHM